MPGSLVGVLSMTPATALPLFIISVSVTLAAAALFADRLDHIGPRLGFPEALTGLLTAVAADGPEVSSALIALANGDKKVSLGVILGSNVFNIAAMIGVSAIVARTVRIGRAALAVEGTVSILVAVIAAGLIAGLLSPPIAAIATRHRRGLRPIRAFTTPRCGGRSRSPRSPWC